MIRNVLTSQKQISGVFLTRNWIQNGASYCIVLQQLIIIWPAEKQWILYFLSVITFCVNLWKYPNPVTRCMTNKLCHLVSHVNRCISSPFFFAFQRKSFIDCLVWNWDFIYSKVVALIYISCDSVHHSLFGRGHQFLQLHGMCVVQKQTHAGTERQTWEREGEKCLPVAGCRGWG